MAGFKIFFYYRIRFYSCIKKPVTFFMPDVTGCKSVSFYLIIILLYQRNFHGLRATRNLNMQQIRSCGAIPAVPLKQLPG